MNNAFTNQTTECYRLLNELLAKYPNSVKDISETLTDIKREYEMWDRYLNQGEPPYDQKLAEEWLEKLKSYEN